jgi:LAS superfamily LD-carboxypeptidase LdcB
MHNFPNSRRLLCFVAAALATLTVASTTAPAYAASSDPYTERKNVQKQKKAIDAEVSNLKKTDAQLQKEIADLNAKVSASKAAYDAASLAAQNAAQAADLARGSEAQTTANYNRLKGQTKNLALQLYMHGFEDKQVPKLDAKQLAAAAAHGYLRMRAIARGQDITVRLGQLRDQMVAARQQAEAAAAAAAAERARQQSTLGSLQANRTKQKNVQTAVEARLEAALAEASFLAARDKALSAEIARRAKGGGGGSGRISVGNIDTVTVQGITVARSIASNVNSLLNAARADGIELSGWGYRDSDQQIALRRAHCGTSDYDVYEKPANQCHPPTARPGASMHERGLAIDFTYGGSIITSHSSEAWQWLNKNASKYGLYNLASEPWHWSTNGN